MNSNKQKTTKSNVTESKQKVKCKKKPSLSKCQENENENKKTVDGHQRISLCIVIKFVYLQMFIIFQPNLKDIKKYKHKN